MRKYRFVFPLFGLFVLWTVTIQAEQVPVHHTEGLVHGFLILRTLDGTPIADGDLLQKAESDRVTSRIVFHFKDGSLHDETAVFTDRGKFHLLHDHLVQKGPSFRRPLEATIDAAARRVTVRYTEDGKEKTAVEHLDLPDDVSNGMIFILMKNIRASTQETKVSWVAYTPKPRVVRFSITPHGEDEFSTGNTSHKSLHYIVKVEVGGVSGVLAEALGKEPPDTHVWVMQGEAPAFVKSEGPLAFGGPIWRVELASPAWPKTADSESSGKDHPK